MRKLKCHLCSFNTQFKSTLIRHKSRDHFDDLSLNFEYKCHTCRLGYFSRDNYLQHVNLIHKDNGSRFKCIVKYKDQIRGNEIEYECGKIFQIMASARRHLQLLHKIQAKDSQEAKKYLKIVMTSKNQFRRSKYCSYGGNYLAKTNNKNIVIKEEIVPEVDDPDEILKILENNDTADDLESNVPCLTENICIIEEKFIPDITPVLPIVDDISNAEVYKFEQIKIEINKPIEEKLIGRNKKVTEKKKKMANLPSKKVTVKPKQVQVPTKSVRASLSRSCKNSVEILESSTSKLDSGEESESDNEPESESETETESELESDSIPKSKNPGNLTTNETEVKISKKDKNESSLSCHLCDKKFSRPDHLRHHLISSLHPENRVECTKCPESHFVIKGNLIKHHKDVKYGRKRLKNVPKSRVRPKDKEFPCTKCHKVFALNYTLKCHQSYCNVREKKFNCKDCNLPFTTLENLNRHLKRSSRHAPNKGKKYFCDKCSSGFTKAPDLKKHIQAKHEKDRTRFDCTICSRSYGRYDTLLAHLKKEEHKLREQDFQKKNQNKNNPLKIKNEK